MQLPPLAHQPQPSVPTHVSSTVMPTHVGQHEPWATKGVLPSSQRSLIGTHTPPHQWQMDSTVHSPQLSKVAQ